MAGPNFTTLLKSVKQQTEHIGKHTIQGIEILSMRNYARSMHNQTKSPCKLLRSPKETSNKNKGASDSDRLGTILDGLEDTEADVLQEFGVNDRLRSDIASVSST
ncbi:hypothetical protein CONPUDRAFT_71241 [Coniophora puteana RWD-64-598 SS2]|uniref:Uncharacterized protein n=1 Tax=Coniophora puteana (strain RWD-64-598) TaxID=741705 RepID=A0A5M3N0P2_CONPW|nr:uncharacterized protein CONPUDRAFT_71241 [Coniophora puteana RWD-64-598 SS2]EIW84475.1 hypothetical protein CONPUDRAFT_71241 [Coniophora puteana RWD-64-598 SS2]